MNNNLEAVARAIRAEHVRLYGLASLPDCEALAQAAINALPDIGVLVEENERREFWAVLYLHDWDPPKDGVQPIYPECHCIFATWQEAEAERASRINPERYYVRRANLKARAALERHQ